VPTPALVDELIFQRRRVDVGVGFLPMHLRQACVPVDVDPQLEPERLPQDAALRHVRIVATSASVSQMCDGASRAAPLREAAFPGFGRSHRYPFSRGE
jgi:hypothetical protein